MKMPLSLRFLALALVSVPLAAQADIYWTGTTGAWDVGTNWVGGAVPTAGSGSVYVNGGTAQLGVGVSGTTGSPFFKIGEGSDGALSITGGSLTSLGGTYLGDHNNGTAIVSSGTWTNANSLYVGYYASGTLAISGGYVSANGTYLGKTASGNATVVVTGGTLNLNNFLYIGEQGSASFLVDGGLVRSAASTLGLNGGSGTATVNSGTWTAASVVVGRTASGTSTLQLNGGVLETASVSGSNANSMFSFNGGTLRATGDNTNFVTGFSSGVTVNSSGAFVDTNGFNIGISSALSGGGSLIKLGAGTLTLSGSNTYVAGTIIHTGTLAVATGGSINQSSDLLIGNSPGDNAGFLVNGGLVSDATGYITYNVGGITSTAIVTSGTWQNSADLYVGYTGTGSLLINGGLVQDTFGGHIGYRPFASGTATVTSGTWQNASVLYVGESGAGTLLVNGGLVTNTTGYVGDSIGSNGSATVTSGTWQSSVDLYVGNSGTGSLLVNGGVVANQSGYIGHNAGSSGTAEVSSGRWTISRGLYVGYSGTGDLLVDGGYVSSPESSSIGSSAGSRGTVTVTSGTFSNSGVALSVGHLGAGSLLVSGGLVTDYSGYIGYMAGGSGSATVSGGTWENDGNLFVGNSGTGSLTVSGSGLVTAPLVVLASGSGAAGTLNLNGGVLATSRLSKGSGSSASVSFNGGTLRATGNNATFITGFAPGDLAINAGGAFIDSNGFAVGTSYSFAGTGNFTKLGLGTLTLTGTNSYLGVTAVKSGTLAVSSGGVIDNSISGVGQYEVQVGLASGDNGAVLLSGGRIVDSVMSLGTGSGATGSATVSSGTWTNSLYAEIGNSGTGTLTLNGGLIQSYSTLIGSTAGATGSAVVSGGELRSTNGIAVGNAGTGSLLVNGGLVTDDIGSIGSRTGGQGFATVSSGTWANTSSLWVGELGSGTLSVTDSGVVSVGAGAGTLTLGFRSGGIGTLNLGTGGTAGSLQVAAITAGSGTGTVNFNHTGTLTLAAGMTGALSIDKLGSGTTTLTGSSTISGPTMINGGALLVQGAIKQSTADFTVGYYSGDVAELQILNGGLVSGSNGYIARNGHSTATVAGGTWNSTALFEVAEGGTASLNINTGGLVSAQTIWIATGTFANGAVTVNGGTMTSATTLIVGYRGSGTLNITNGLVSVGTDLAIGNSPGSQGTVNLNTGGLLQNAGVGYVGLDNSALGIMNVNGGTWNSTGAINVGRNSTATLTLNSGYISSSNVNVGTTGTGNGIVNVNDGTWAYLSTLNLGNSGTGTLNLTGGLVSGSFANLGSGTTSAGFATVSGGTLAIASTMNVGSSGVGNMLINGGRVSAAGVVVGSSATSSGTLTVTSGTLSTSNSGGLRVAESGRGTLILNGGLISGNGAYIGTQLNSTGLAIVNGGTWNTGGLTVGTSGTGSLQINGGLVSTGTLSTILGNSAGSVGLVTLAGGVLETSQVAEGSSTGTFVFNGGTLRAMATQANFFSNFDPGDLQIAGGGAVIDSGTYSIGTSNALSGTGALTKLGSGTLTLSGSNDYTGGTTISAGTLQIGSGGSSGSIVGDVVNNGQLFFNRSTALTYGGAISGTGNFTKTGVGTLTLTGSSSYTGNSTVRSGTLVLDGATLNHPASYMSIGHPDGNGSLVLINGARLVSSAGNIGNDATTFGSATVTSGTWTISGGLGIGIFGRGSLLVNGGLVTSNSSDIGNSATASGTATVSSGTWTVASASALNVGNSGTGILNLADTGVLSVGSGSGTVTLGKNAGSSGTLNLGTGGTAGTLFAARVTTGSGSGVVNFNHTGSLDFATAMAGTLSVNKLGAGTTVLTGSSSYTGDTTISAGKLAVNGVLGNTAVTVGRGATLSGTGSIGGSVVAQNGSTIAPGNSPGTLTVSGSFTFQSGSLFAVEGDGALFDRIDVGGAATIESGANISFTLLTSPTEVSYTLLTAASGLDGAVKFSLVGAFPAGYSLVYSGTALMLVQQGTIGTVTVTPADPTIITGGTTSVTVTVENSSGTGSQDLNATVTGTGSEVTGTGTTTVAGGTTGTSAPDLAFSSTTVGTQTGTVAVTDPNASNSPQTGTTSVTVLDHAGPTLTVTGGNNQTVIIGATGVDATLNLANGATGTNNLSPMDVANLGAGLSGTTGSGVIASGSSANYTASLNTGTVGANQAQTFSLDAGDDQSLPGATALTTQTGTVTLTVLDHAAPNLTLTGSDNQSVIVGATGITATLTLANGAGGTVNLSPMDVQNLSTGLSGTTGSGAIASGASSTYTGSLNTSTVGAGQTQTFSLDAGDQQTLAGANPLTTQSSTVTLNVYGHADPILSGTTLALGNIHVGYAAAVTSSTQTVTNGSSGDYIVDLKASGTTSGNLSVNDVSGLSAGQSASVIATLATGQGVGVINENLPYTFADDSTLAGASSNLSAPSLNVTGLVYSGQGVWTSTSGGSWGTLASGFGANWQTTGGSPGLDSNFTDTDTATFGTAGSGVVTLDGAFPSLKGITFDNASRSYELQQGSGGVITLNGGTGTATIENLNGTHLISASVTLATDTVVSVANSGDVLGFTPSSVIGGAGQLIKQGAGSVILTSANTYSGGTRIEAGTVSTSNTAALGTGAVSLNAGTLAPVGHLTINSLTWTGGQLGLALGSGGVFGSSTLEVAGNATNGGAGGSFAFSEGTGFATNTSYTILVVDGTMTGFSLADFTGNALLGLAPTFTLVGNELRVSFNGAVSGGTLSNYAPVYTPTTADFLVNGNVQTSNAPNTVNSLTFTNGSLLTVFNRLAVTSGLFTVNSGSATMGGPGLVSTPGDFTKLGSGLLNILTTLIAKGNINVQQGTLSINGTASAQDLIVQLGAVLKGSGFIFGNVFNNGTVAPGNSPGTLTINGNYTQSSSGSLQIELASPSVFDRLIVNGNAQLGGQLQVLSYGGYKFQYGQQFAFLQADSISGSFSSIVTSDPKHFRARFLTDDGTGTILLAPSSYTLVAQNQNQRNVAKALNSYIPASGDKEKVSIALDYLTADQYPAAFEQIMPGFYESLGNMTIEQSVAQSQVVAQRLSAVQLGARGFSTVGIETALVNDKNGRSVLDAKDGKDILTPTPDNRWGVWVQGNGIFARTYSVANVPNSHYESGGIFTGLDYQWNEHLTTGLYAGYQGLYSKYSGGGLTTINSSLFGGYATYRQGGFYADAITGGGYNGYNTRRPIKFSTVDRTADASPYGGQFSTYVDAGYDWKVKGFTFGPLLSGQYTYAGIAPFTERDANSLNLRVNQQNINSLRMNVGGRVAYTWTLNEKLTLVPELRLFWQHEFLENPRNIGAALDGGNGPGFGYETSTPDRDSVFAGVGVSAQFGDRWDASFYYNANFGRSDFFSNMISTSFGFKF